MTGLSEGAATINSWSWRRRRRVKAVLWCVIAFADTWVRYNRLCVPVRRIHNSCYLRRRCYDVLFSTSDPKFWSSRSFRFVGGGGVKGRGKGEGEGSELFTVIGQQWRRKWNLCLVCYLSLKLSARCDWCRVSWRSRITLLFWSPFFNAGRRTMCLSSWECERRRCPERECSRVMGRAISVWGLHARSKSSPT